jgi:thymidylate synthase (FAD)
MLTVPIVQLLSITPEAESLIERAGCTCYGSTPGRPTQRIARWIEMGHESVLEHASATFAVTCSRVASHELVRHRLASYSQQSQRYCPAEPDFYVPAELAQEPLYTELLRDGAHTYGLLLGQGIPRQLARYLLPGATLTEIVVTMNFRELRHFIRLRASPRAQPEMAELARAMLAILTQKVPSVFGDLAKN